VKVTVVKKEFGFSMIPIEIKVLNVSPDVPFHSASVMVTPAAVVLISN
jgi:hypothetical protein